MGRWLWPLLVFAVVALAWQLTIAPGQVLAAWLVAWLALLALSLGSLALRMLHVLTGGEWGEALRLPLAVFARLLPLALLFALPLLLGMRWVFPWLDGSAVDPHLDAQRWYLAPWFVWLRWLICAVVWLWLEFALRRRLGTHRPARGLAGAGLVLLLLTVTVIAADWVMSLAPRWHSTDLGAIVFVTDLLLAFAAALRLRLTLGAPLPTGTLRDIGNLLLATVLGFGYLGFMDFLTAWIADQPDELAWYLPRVATGWRWLGGVLVLGGVLLPFALLLSRRFKAAPHAMLWLARWLCVATLAYLVWLVLPSVRLRGDALAWSDPLPLLVAFVAANRVGRGMWRRVRWQYRAESPR